MRRWLVVHVNSGHYTVAPATNVRAAVVRSTRRECHRIADRLNARMPGRTT
jgi:hypothetical protein